MTKNTDTDKPANPISADGEAGMRQPENSIDPTKKFRKIYRHPHTRILDYYNKKPDPQKPTP